MIITITINKFYIGGSTDLSEIRTSKNTWIEDGTSDLVDKISLRINRFTGLQTTKIYDDFKEGKKDEYESLQVHGSNMFQQSRNLMYHVLITRDRRFSIFMLSN